MPDLQKVDVEYTVRLSRNEMAWICNALRGAEDLRREEWTDLAARLIQKQIDWSEEQSRLLTNLLKRGSMKEDEVKR